MSLSLSSLSPQIIAVAPVLDAAVDRCNLHALAQRIGRAHANIECADCEGVWHASQAGENLNYGKDQIDHGEFKLWLREALPAISDRTCQRYMKAASILRSLPGYPLCEPGVEPSKSLREQQLEVIRVNGLTSLRKVLKLNDASGESTSTKRSSTKRTVVSELAPTLQRLDDDWQSPLEIVASAIELFGVIDLDPCGVDDPAFHLPASRTLTPADDSLASATAWRGRLLVHPPVSQIGQFVERTAEAVKRGEAKEAIMLIPAETDAPHMAVLQPYAKAFLRSRPTFASPLGELSQPECPYMLVFLTCISDRVTAFAESFGHIADIYHPHCF